MSENSTVSTGIEQGRATQAYSFVDEMKGSSDWKEYRSGVKKLPVLIKTNGLGQALAFIQNRNNFPKMYQQLGAWLQDKKKVVKPGDLVQEVIKMESVEYRQVTVETLAMLNWMRRFVDGLNPEKD